MSRTRVLVTGFEPFAGWPRNPSEDVVRALARDPPCRAAGVRTAVLPVHRHRAPRRLADLLSRHRPDSLVLTGLASGRTHACFERIAVNCYRRPGDVGVGRPISPAGPLTLEASVPVQAALEALGRGRVPVAVSHSAGTFTCNLLLYLALLWGAEGLPGGAPAPARVAFIHLPATPESMPAGRAGPTLPLAGAVRAVRALALHLAGTGNALTTVRAGGRDGT